MTIATIEIRGAFFAIDNIYSLFSDINEIKSSAIEIFFSLKVLLKMLRRSNCHIFSDLIAKGRQFTFEIQKKF